MLVYAHRGSSKLHPENTLEAFRAAMVEGADGIETDLRLTLDGRIILHHDESVFGLKIKDHTLAALRRAGGANGGGITLLAELLDLARGKILLNLEIKDPATVPLLPTLLRPEDTPLVTSFHVEAYRLAREHLPALQAGLVFSRFGEAETELVAAEKPDVVCLKARLLSPEAHAFCRERQAKLLLWVVNGPAKARKLDALGLDGVFTDLPGKIVRALKFRKGSDVA